MRAAMQDLYTETDRSAQRDKLTALENALISGNLECYYAVVFLDVRK